MPDLIAAVPSALTDLVSTIMVRKDAFWGVPQCACGFRCQHLACPVLASMNLVSGYLLVA